LRLDRNGSLDAGFDIGAGPDSSINATHLQPDGKILIGGWFQNVSGVPRRHLARLNANGSLDPNFHPVVTGSYSYPSINCLAIQADGKILLGGAFTTLGGTNRNHIARLNADGTLDTNFNPNVVGLVNTLALQTDGRILLGGSFTSVGGQTRNRIAQ
jgi:uncharacterized delta-60 repeat protein